MSSAYIPDGTRLLASAARYWSGGTGTARGICQMFHHLLVVGAGKSCDPCLAGIGRRLSGERSGACGGPIGEEIGYRMRHYGTCLNTARSGGIELRKEGGTEGSSKDRGPQGSAILETDGGRSRPQRRGVREPAAAATCVYKTPTLHVQTGSKEALPHKMRTTALWPRRDCRGLHLHRGAF